MLNEVTQAPAGQEQAGRGERQRRRRMAQPLPLPVDHRAQADHPDEQRGERQAFERNGQPGRERQAEHPATTARIARMQPDHGAQRRDDLPAMVIDAQGLHLVQHDARKPDDDPGRHGRVAAEQAIGRVHRQGQRAQHGQRRNDHRCGDFGVGRAQQRAQRHDRGRDRQVDQARPVHQHAFGRHDAILVQIEPALPGQQIAHLDQAQHVVGIAHAQRGNVARKDQSCSPTISAQMPSTIHQRSGAAAIVSGGGGPLRQRKKRDRPRRSQHRHQRNTTCLRSTQVAAKLSRSPAPWRRADQAPGAPGRPPPAW
jgi:hypothetical protein